MAAPLASMGQALGKVNGLLEEVESEWLGGSTAESAACSSVNHRRERTAKPANDHLSGQSLNEPLKLSSGERRILTALAQYPHGRSKVQVALLTGYAATGGGFNNYGALRSRGLIQGDANKLTITELGIRAPHGFSSSKATSLNAASRRFVARCCSLYGAAMLSWRAAWLGLKAIRREGLGEVLRLAQIVVSVARELGAVYFQTAEMSTLFAVWGMRVDFGPDVAGGGMFPILETYAGVANGINIVRGGV